MGGEAHAHALCRVCEHRDEGSFERLVLVASRRAHPAEDKKKNSESELARLPPASAERASRPKKGVV